MSDSELLQRIVQLLEDNKNEQLQFKQTLHQALDDAKTRDEKLRGEMHVLQGGQKTIEGSITRLDGNVIILGAAVEELERSERKVLGDIALLQQQMDGVAQLSKTNFDQTNSLLEHVTGTKGADRVKKTLRPSEPG